jgi:hypothetical protein
MIYYNDKKWGKSLEALLNQEGFEPYTEEEKRLIYKEINKGNNVYFLINPFHSEMGSGEEGHLEQLMWDTNQDDLNALSNQLAEEI